MPYPIVVDLKGKRCVVVGAGPVAERRVLGLLAEGAKVVVVAPQATDALAKLSMEGAIEWERGAYAPNVLANAILVFAATGNAEVNAAVASDGAARNVLVCRVDEASEGDFITPAAIQRGDLLIALSTGGNSPTLAAVLKEKLQHEFGPEWSAWTELFGRLRPFIQTVQGEEERRKAVRAILQSADVEKAIFAGDLAKAEELALETLLAKGKPKRAPDRSRH
jgi:siroheme synthase-like protein